MLSVITSRGLEITKHATHTRTQLLLYQSLKQIYIQVAFVLFLTNPVPSGPQ